MNMMTVQTVKKILENISTTTNIVKYGVYCQNEHGKYYLECMVGDFRYSITLRESESKSRLSLYLHRVDYGCIGSSINLEPTDVEKYELIVLFNKIMELARDYVSDKFTVLIK